jgi:hypothetical protein
VAAHSKSGMAQSASWGLRVVLGATHDQNSVCQPNVASTNSRRYLEPPHGRQSQCNARLHPVSHEKVQFSVTSPEPLGEAPLLPAQQSSSPPANASYSRHFGASPQNGSPVELEAACLPCSATSLNHCGVRSQPSGRSRRQSQHVQLSCKLRRPGRRGRMQCARCRKHKRGRRVTFPYRSTLTLGSLRN